MTMRPAWAVAVAMLAGLATGLGSAWLVLHNGQLLGRVERDHWFGNDRVGSTDADPYTRAIIATIGLLALNRSETIYFHRYRDHEGEPLREGCVYEMTGGSLPARWWSITVYAEDDFLPVNGDNAHSVDSRQVARDDAGRWSARVADDRSGAANWIATRNAGRYSLSLRLYNPDASARDDASAIAFPALTRRACREHT